MALSPVSIGFVGGDVLRLCPNIGQQEQSDGLAKWMLDLGLSFSKLRSMVDELLSRRNLGMTFSDVISPVFYSDAMGIVSYCWQSVHSLMTVAAIASSLSRLTSCELVHSNGDNWTKIAALPPDSDYLL